MNIHRHFTRSVALLLGLALAVCGNFHGVEAAQPGGGPSWSGVPFPGWGWVFSQVILTGGFLFQLGYTWREFQHMRQRVAEIELWRGGHHTLCQAEFANQSVIDGVKERIEELHKDVREIRRVQREGGRPRLRPVDFPNSADEET